MSIPEISFTEEPRDETSYTERYQDEHPNKYDVPRQSAATSSITPSVIIPPHVRIEGCTPPSEEERSVCSAPSSDECEYTF